MQVKRFRVRVPASTSNLGSGFDTVSAALRLYLTVDVEVEEGSRIRWLTPWPEEEDNLVDCALRAALGHLGIKPPGLSLAMRNPIPLKRGLGSSGAAIIAGIKIAERLAGESLSPDECLRLAYPLEGHPDNLAASLLGGWVLSRIESGEVRCEQIEARLKCRFVIAVPEITVSTRRAREILPQSYSLEDAVYNLQRCALLVHALYVDRPQLLKEALQDRLHQPYRQGLVPGLSELLARRNLPGELDQQLLGVALSGSGSAVAALVAGSGEAIGAWMLSVLSESGTRGEVMNLDLDSEGARFETR